MNTPGHLPSKKGIVKYSRLLLTLFCLSLPFISFAQQHDDIRTLKHKLTLSQPDSTKMWVYSYIFKYYSAIDNDSALMYVEQGLESFRKTGYQQGQVKMLCEIGDYEDIHGNSAEASSNYLEALNITKTDGDKNGMATAYNNLGAEECKKGSYPKAIGYFIEAKKIFDVIGEKEGVFSALCNIATLFDSEKDSVNAMKYYAQAEVLSKSIPMSEYVITLFVNMGQFYTDRNDSAHALPYLKKAVSLSTEPKYINVHIGALMSLGNLLYKMGKEKEATPNLHQALALAKQNNLPDFEAQLLTNCAEIFENEHPDSAIVYLNRAVALAKATSNNPAELLIYKDFARFYEKRKDFAAANKYLKLSYELSDSLLAIDKAKQIANLASLYELKLSNTRVNELEVLNHKNKWQRNIIIGIALLLIVLIGVIWFFYRKSTRLNKNLEMSKSELTDLNNMKDKLFSVIGHDLRGPIGNITPIINLIEEEAPLLDEHRQLLKVLKEHSSALMDTLDKLMLLGQSVMKGKNYSPISFNANDLTTTNIDLLTLAASNKNIDIENHVPLDAQVFGDPGHFDFIVRNLLSNAIKFSYADGKVEIGTTQNDAEEMITFFVKDNGTGISDYAMQHIFKDTLKSTYGTAHEKGTGIGLKLCEEFATANGGKIWVEPGENNGAVFYFSLKKG